MRPRPSARRSVVGRCPGFGQTRPRQMLVETLPARPLVRALPPLAPPTARSALSAPVPPPAAGASVRRAHGLERAPPPPRPSALRAPLLPAPLRPPGRHGTRALRRVGAADSRRQGEGRAPGSGPSGSSPAERPGLSCGSLSAAAAADSFGRRRERRRSGAKGLRERGVLRRPPRRAPFRCERSHRPASASGFGLEQRRPAGRRAAERRGADFAGGKGEGGSGVREGREKRGEWRGKSGRLQRKDSRIPVWLQPSLPTCREMSFVPEMRTKTERWPRGGLTQGTIFALRGGNNTDLDSECPPRDGECEGPDWFPTLTGVLELQDGLLGYPT